MWPQSPPRAKKYHGLENQGATCYLNTVLQVLFMTEKFRERIKSFCRENARTEHIDAELGDLFARLEERSARTEKITSKLRIQNVHKQRDAAEHYEKILRLTSRSASQIFHGELINRNKCLKCHAVTKRDAGFWHLPLPLVCSGDQYSVVRMTPGAFRAPHAIAQSAPAAEKGIEDFFRPSTLSGDDQMYCEKCDAKCDAELDCSVQYFPEVLVLLLKRFETVYAGDSVKNIKINCPVKMPYRLHLEKSYRLYAFVEHLGDLQCGHYTADIQSQDDGRWYHFDDLDVKESEYQHLQLDPSEMFKDVYLLFYQQQTEDKSLTHSAGPDTWATRTAEVGNGTGDPRRPWSPHSLRSCRAEEAEGRKARESTGALGNGRSESDKPDRRSHNRASNRGGVQSQMQHDDKPNDKHKEAKRVKDRMKHGPSQNGRDSCVDGGTNRSAFQNQPFARYPGSMPPPGNMQRGDGDWTERARGAGRQSGQLSPFSKEERKPLSQRNHPGSGDFRPHHAPYNPAANANRAVTRSQSCAPGRGYRPGPGSGSGHLYWSGAENEMRIEGRSVDPDRGGPRSYSFHGQQRPMNRPRDLLGIIRETQERNGQIKREPSSIYYDKKVAEAARSRQVEHKPQLHSTPQRCLERAGQRPQSSHKSSTGRGRGAAEAKKTTNYSGQDQSLRKDPSEPEEGVAPLGSGQKVHGLPLHLQEPIESLEVMEEPVKKRKKIHFVRRIREIFSCMLLKRKRSK